jgi:hypothetical protein
MCKKKIVLIAAMAVAMFGVIGIPGCAKDDTAVIGNSIEVTKTVSFSTDLVPLLSANCALSGCHVKGGVAPDLEAANAYSQLTSMGLYNTNSPASSIVYERLMGVLTPAMPLNGASNPGNINGYMLAWIKQGANNN